MTIETKIFMFEKKFVFFIFQKSIFYNCEKSTVGSVQKGIQRKYLSISFWSPFKKVSELVERFVTLCLKSVTNELYYTYLLFLICWSLVPFFFSASIALLAFSNCFCRRKKPQFLSIFQFDAIFLSLKENNRF